ncbi:MAG: TolC family protein [Acidobacteria bacterium]|nr:TolC family protein [Acidobacteriota bacterium]
MKVTHSFHTLFLMLCFFAVSSLQAQETLTLQESLAQAKANPRYQARLQFAESLQGKAIQAGKRPNPYLETQGEFVPSDVSEEHSLSLVLWQKWERGGKRKFRTEVAQSEVKQFTLESEDFLRSLTAEISFAYINLLQLEKQIEILEGYSQRIGQLIKVDEIRVSEGEIAALNLDYLRSEVLLFGARKDQMESELKRSRYRFNELVGLPADSSHRLQVDEFPRPALPAPQQAIAYALSNRPDLKRLREAISGADGRIRLERALGKQDWSLGLGYKRARDGFDDIRLTPLSHGLTDTDHLMEVKLTIPFAVWDNNAGNIAAAIGARKATERDLEAAESRVRREVLYALEQVRISQRQIETYQKNLRPQVEDRFRRIEASYQLTGQGHLDWLQSLRDAVDASMNVLGSDFQLWKSLVQLERELGGSIEEATRAGS